MLAELGIDEVVNCHNDRIFPFHIVKFVARVIGSPRVDIRNDLSPPLPQKVLIAHLFSDHVKLLLLDLKLLALHAILNRKSCLMLLQLVTQLLLQDFCFLFYQLNLISHLIFALFLVELSLSNLIFFLFSVLFSHGLVVALCLLKNQNVAHLSCIVF